MIIKGVFRRYERWNPVHPTAGAFWGIGIGIGCGVGWGPGFGPEVIGYVGAGCGTGFSVGFTLLGLGIGLPANYFFTVPYDAFMVTRSGALEIARSSGLSVRNVARDGWYYFGPHISAFQQRAGGTFSRFKTENSLENGVHLSNLKSTVLSCAKPIQNQIQNVVARFFPPQREVNMERQLWNGDC